MLTSTNTVISISDCSCRSVYKWHFLYEKSVLPSTSPYVKRRKLNYSWHFNATKLDTLTLGNQNGGFSLHNSYKIHPRAHTSLANEKQFSVNVSGAIYDGVPLASITLLAVVIRRFLKSPFPLMRKWKIKNYCPKS